MNPDKQTVPDQVRKDHSAPTRRGHGPIALADQCVVSGISLLTVLILSRVAGVAELGLYAIAISFGLLAQSFQTALVLVPFTVFAPRLGEDEFKQCAGSALVQAIGICVMSSLLILLASLLPPVASSSYAGVIRTLSIVITGMLLRDFARRMAFARMEFREATLVDAAAAAVRVILLVSLAWSSKLTATSALISIGISDALAAACWFLARRGMFLLNRNRIMKDVAANVDFGRWGLASQLAHSGQTNVVQWTIATLLGPMAMGTYSACSSVVQLSGPLIQGAGNYLTPAASTAFANGGPRLLFLVARDGTKAMAFLLAAYGITIALAAGLLLKLFFGEEMADQSLVVMVLATSLIFNGLGLPAAKAISVLGRPDCNFAVNLAGTVLTALAAVYAAQQGSLFGAAMGASIGAGVTFLCRMAVYHHFVALENSREVEA